MKARVARAYPAPKFTNTTDAARFAAWKDAQHARVGLTPILPCPCGCMWPAPRCGRAVA